MMAEVPEHLSRAAAVTVGAPHLAAADLPLYGGKRVLAPYEVDDVPALLSNVIEVENHDVFLPTVRAR
jgi:hypothetical protein